MTEDIIPPPIKKKLGEAEFAKYAHVDNHGHKAIQGEGLVALTAMEADGTFEFIASGFFIAPGGLFATAKHNLLPPRSHFNLNDLSQRKLTFEITPAGYLLSRRVVSLVPHPTADVAIGHAISLDHAPDIYSQPHHMICRLTTVKPAVGDGIVAMGFPRTSVAQPHPSKGFAMSLTASAFEGKVTQHWPERAPMPECGGFNYQTSMPVRPATSGGPVFDMSARVIGIVSTGIDSSNDFPEPVAFVASIESIFDLRIEVAPNETKSVRELAEMGLVPIAP